MAGEKKTSAEATVPETGAEKQRRARVTRRQLVRAARTIFARDGFEQARIVDIAAAVGKTRGAFYDHFEDKEDVFFAIFEEDIENDTGTLRPVLASLETLDERLERLAEHLSDKTRDRQRNLLNLEFKAYAIRHPRRRTRLADLHAAMCERCSLPEIDEFLPGWDAATPTAGSSFTRAEKLAIGALMDGLALNQLFDPGTVDEALVRRVMRLGLDEILRLRPEAIAQR